MSSKILVLPGSLREGSINQQLAVVLNQALLARGINTELVDLGDYPMPIFNQDIEAPASVTDLAARVQAADGFVIVSPEYNASVTPLLKNTIDWISTTRPNAASAFGPFKDKVCFLAACSPGSLGGIRGLYHLRAILMNVGAEIITAQLAVGGGVSAFNEEGGLADTRQVKMLETGLDDFLFHVARMVGGREALLSQHA